MYLCRVQLLIKLQIKIYNTGLNNMYVFSAENKNRRVMFMKVRHGRYADNDVLAIITD